METPLIKELTKKGVESYINERQYDALYWPTLFPIKNVNRLDSKTIIGDKGNRVIADIISYDTSAPKGSRRSFKTKNFDIPKIAKKFELSESDLLEYRIAQALGGPEAILKLIYDQVDDCYDANVGRMEWLSLQAASMTKIKLSATNNPQGIVNETYVDFGMPDTNKKAVAVVWSLANKATMTPITDFKTVVKSARGKGIKFAKVLMHPDAFDFITGSTEYQTAAKSLVAGESLLLGYQGLETVNKVFKSLRLPEIALIETSVEIEDKAGEKTAVNPWDVGHVLFVPATTLGNMHNGPIAEELFPPKNVIQAKKGNVLISLMRGFDPVTQITKGECNAFPSWNSVNKCYNLYTEATTWAL